MIERDADGMPIRIWYGSGSREPLPNRYADFRGVDRMRQSTPAQRDAFWQALGVDPPVLIGDVSEEPTPPEAIAAAIEDARREGYQQAIEDIRQARRADCDTPLE